MGIISFNRAIIKLEGYGPNFAMASELILIGSISRFQAMSSIFIKFIKI